MKRRKEKRETDREMKEGGENDPLEWVRLQKLFDHHETKYINLHLRCTSRSVCIGCWTVKVTLQFTRRVVQVYFEK